MSEVSSWAPLAEENPIPGNPDAIAALVARLDATADAIEEQNGRLRSVNSSEFWEGDAAEGFENHKKDLPPLLGKVVTRYRGVSGALGTYRPILTDAQGMAHEALVKAQAAEEEIRRAQQGIDEMEAFEQQAQARAESYNQDPPGGPARSPEEWSGPNWNYALQDAQEEKESAKALLADAVEMRDQAGRELSASIGEAIDDDLKNDTGLWATGKRLVTGAARWVVENTPIEGLAQVVSIAAAIVGVAAIFFPVLAPIALGLAAASLLLESTLFLAGEKDWKDLAWAAGGVMTFGMGRALGAAGRAYGALKGARGIIATGETTIGIARSGQRALASMKSLKGLSAISARGKKVFGIVAKNVRNSQYADEIARGEKMVAQGKEAAKTAWAHPDQAAGRFLPRKGTWGRAFSPKQIRKDFITDLDTIRSEGLGRATQEHMSEMWRAGRHGDHGVHGRVGLGIDVGQTFAEAGKTGHELMTTDLQEAGEKIKLIPPGTPA